MQFKYSMHYTDPETDFWPWHWEHNGKVCETTSDYRSAWQSIDWVNDSVFDPYASKTQNKSGEPMIRPVAQGIKCVTAPVDVSDKIKLADYQEYAINKFDQQMQKIANKGKLSLGLSAGVDSTMCLAWLVKNKVDFEVFSWVTDPWKGELNNLVVDYALKMTKLLGVKHRLIDYSKGKPNQHDLLRDYCEADSYNFPQSHLMSEGDTWNEVYDDIIDGGVRLEPFGIDDQFLHEQSSWNRFIPKQLMTYLSVKNHDNPAFQLFWQDYQVGGKEAYWKSYCDPKQGHQMMSGWHDVLVDYMDKGQMISPATSKEWYEAWHRIDETSCSDEQFKDIIAVKWLKRQIVEWTGKDEMADWTKSTPCTEIYYSPDANNSKYLMDECSKISKIYYDNEKVEKAAWWRGMVDMISKFGKVSPRAVESIHTINWLLKNKI